MDFASLSTRRYSLRKFSSKEVEAEKLRAILEAARSAPTACNYQPQRVFVLQSREAMEKADSCAGCHFNSPVMLIVAYDEKTAWTRSDGVNFGQIDSALAISQMMLQATDLGLGSIYIGMFDAEKLHQEFPQLEGLTPVALLDIGYEAENARPSRLHADRKPLEETVSYL